MYSKFSYANKSNSPSILTPDGIITTTSPDPDYIEDNIRGNSNLLFDPTAGFVDNAELYNVYTIPDGGYLEYEANSFEYEQFYHHFHNSANSCRIAPSFGGYRVYTTTNEFLLFPFSNVRGSFIWRLERTGNDYEVFKDGISQGTQTATTGVVSIDIIGMKDNSSNSCYARIDYVDFNGDRFDFNEAMDDPYIYITP